MAIAVFSAWAPTLLSAVIRCNRARANSGDAADLRPVSRFSQPSLVPLDLSLKPATCRGASRLDGRCCFGAQASEVAEESPGSMDGRWRLTAAGGDPRDSATEKRPPGFGRVRVKRRCKRPPRSWRQGRLGKPHREQDQIGVGARVRATGCCEAGSGPHSGWLLEARRKSRPRRMTVAEGNLQTKPGLQADWLFRYP